MGSNEAALLAEALRAALSAADPVAATKKHLPSPPAGRLIVVGAGKAASAMAAAASAGYQDVERFGGAVITRHGQALAAPRVQVLEGAHPVPDAASVAGTRTLLGLVDGAGPDDLVLCLLSGGGSALACAPVGVSLAEKAAVTRALLAAGADIHELNVVRKHLSGVKGGWLAVRSAAPVVTLAVSDVVGDDQGTIASGPTVADPSTYAEALALLDAYVPGAGAARRALEAGVRGERPETPKPGDERLARSRYEIVASGATSVRAAADHLRAAGVEVIACNAESTGDSTAVALRQAAEVRAILSSASRDRPLAVVYGGETTVKRQGAQLTYGTPQGEAVDRARGGPNGEWALAFRTALADVPGMWLLAADTDGIDGNSTAAGALIGPEQAARLTRIQVADYLRRHDSHTLLERVGGLLVTGPTHTNVNALRVALFAAV